MRYDLAPLPFNGLLTFSTPFLCNLPAFVIFRAVSSTTRALRDMTHRCRTPVLSPLAWLLKSLAIVVIFSLLAPAPADAKKPPRGATEEKEDRSDDALAKRFQLPLAGVGYLVVDAATGTVIESRQPKAGFVPASSIKIASTVAALSVLGAEHRFATELRMTGSVREGVLAGDLFLKGGGDPLLTHDELEVMVGALKAQGIARVAGRFVYDSSDYLTVTTIDPDYEQAAQYNPGIAALSINFNVLKLKWERSKGGNDLTARFVSQTDHGEVEVDYLSAGWAPPGAHAPYGLLYREENGKASWLLAPNVKPKGEIAVPVKQPDFSAASVFRRIAARERIELPQPVAGATPEGARVLHRHSSKPLAEIVQRVQRFSNNMAAELLGLAAARRLSGTALYVPEAAAVLQEWMKRQIAGVDWTGYQLRNSSGLTKDTKITPEQLVAILRHAQKLRFGTQGYPDLLRPYFLGKVKGDSEDDPEATREKVGAQAKTGTVNYSRAVAGYLHTRKGRDIIFAVFVSDFKVREDKQKQDQAHKEPPVRWWMSRSRELQRSLVRRWAETL